MCDSGRDGSSLFNTYRCVCVVCVCAERGVYRQNFLQSAAKNKHASASLLSQRLLSLRLINTQSTDT